MKYLKKFQTNADYQAFKNSSDYITPNISVIKENVSGNDFNIMFEPFVGTVSLIIFTINDVGHQAEEGMTWQEWCDSEYNTYGVYCSGNNIIGPGVFIAGQTPSDVISNGYAYRAMATGSSSGS